MDGRRWHIFFYPPMSTCSAGAARDVSTPGHNRMIAISVLRRVPALMLTSPHAPHRASKMTLSHFHRIAKQIGGH
jgi:hypothetical protein